MRMRPIQGPGVGARKKQRLYSYIRWSSDKQLTGATRDDKRQIAQQFALANGYELTSTYSDPGTSAFRGKTRCIL